MAAFLGFAAVAPSVDAAERPLPTPQNLRLVGGYRFPTFANHPEAIRTTAFPRGGMAVWTDADGNRDGVIDGADLLIWQREFGAATPPPANSKQTSEPAAGALATLAVGWRFPRDRGAARGRAGMALPVAR